MPFKRYQHVCRYFTGGRVCHAAARCPDPTCAALVLAAAAAAMQSLDARDAAGRTPLEIALCHRPRRAPPPPPPGGNGTGGGTGGGGGGGGSGVYRVAVALLDAGASPDVAFSTGAHPLSSAVAACARDLVELLLEVGCSAS